MTQKYSLMTSQEVFILYKLIMRSWHNSITDLIKYTGKERTVILQQLKPLRDEGLVYVEKGTGFRGTPAIFHASKKALINFLEIKMKNKKRWVEFKEITHDGLRKTNQNMSFKKDFLGKKDLNDFLFESREAIYDSNNIADFVKNLYNYTIDGTEEINTFDLK